MLQLTSSTSLNLLLENLFFLGVATSFFIVVGRRWKNSKPFSLPQPLPSWFSAWLSVVLAIGILLPIVAIFVWGIWLGKSSVLQALLPYLILLGLQILYEKVILRQFQSCVWVMIPCLYLPYRIWQLHVGLSILSLDTGTIWVQRLLVAEIVLWIFNYGIHLSQLPWLLRWEVEPQAHSQR